MMDTGDRNFYRILQVQPDAPFEVIRHNYLILFQKLRMHPDLGGNNFDAIRINNAYETLRDPKKRAAYDQLLSVQNNLLKLSQANLTHFSLLSKKTRWSFGYSVKKNKRNYYRILQLHPEAHETVIRERYKVLLKKNELPHDLLKEAYSILSNIEKRFEYDRLLNCYEHSVAVEKMKSSSDKIKIDSRYSNFFKTLHFLGPVNKYKMFSQECDSPLLAKGPEMIEKPGRCVERIKRSENLIFYDSWPGEKLTGILFDISPKGLRFYTEFKLKIGQLIKIEGENFKALAEIIHIRREQKNIFNNGVSFHKVHFQDGKGNFILTTV